MPIRKFKDIGVYEYKFSLKATLMTARFNMETWDENQSFLKEFKKNDPRSMCIYAAPERISRGIESHADVIVLEMNNTLNQIVGFGLIKNDRFEEEHNIYKNKSFNKYSYVGHKHIARMNFTIEEEVIVQVLEKYCFKGKRHQKRMRGITQFPLDMLYSHKMDENLDLVDYVCGMFRDREVKSVVV